MTRFCLAFASGSHVTANFAGGLINLMGGRLAPFIDKIFQVQSGPNIAFARDEMTRLFLGNSQAPALVMVDADMAFATSHVEALLAFTDEAGVVGARYKGFMPATGPVEEAGYVKAGVFSPIILAEGDGDLIDVDVVGAGLIAIRREVFDDVARTGPGEPLPWFADVVRDGAIPLGEDYEFCLRAKAAGHRVALAARVSVPHMKTLAVV